MSKNTKKELTPKKSLRDISPEAKKRAALLVFNTLILTYHSFMKNTVETQKFLPFALHKL